MEMTLKVKKLRDGAVVPKRATEGSAGMDLYALPDGDVTLNPGDISLIPTGIAIELPSPDYVAYIFARSGLAIKHGITLANSVGVVDSDYRGEVCVGLCNISKTPYTVTPGERIAQLVISPVSLTPTEEAEELSDTSRGTGGFGSTGKA